MGQSSSDRYSELGEKVMKLFFSRFIFPVFSLEELLKLFPYLVEKRFNFKEIFDVLSLFYQIVFSSLASRFSRHARQIDFLPYRKAF